MLTAASMFWLAIYWIVFTPFALVYRLFGRDPLKLRRRPTEASYWQPRRDKRFRPMTTLH